MDYVEGVDRVPLEVNLFVVDEGEVRLVDVTGFSPESNERIVDELEVVISGTTEAIAVCGIILHLYQEYPATAWSILIRYSNGGPDWRLTYTTPGEVPEVEQVPVRRLPHSPVDRVSRYVRKPVI